MKKILWISFWVVYLCQGIAAQNNAKIDADLRQEMSIRAASELIRININQTVTANTTITGCSTLSVQNVTVTNNAKLTIISGGDVTFTNFEIISGELEIQ